MKIFRFFVSCYSWINTSSGRVFTTTACLLVEGKLVVYRMTNFLPLDPE